MYRSNLRDVEVELTEARYPYENNENKDYQLQISRRLDWRFLLHDPNLRKVAYLGEKEDTLLQALKVFSHSLTIIDPAFQDGFAKGNNSQFDLVVLRSSNLKKNLPFIYAILKVGGYLYWEIDRFKFFRSRTKELGKLDFQYFKTSRHIDYLIDSLIKQGFCNVEIHWHHPNFEECLKIIPLNDWFALNYFFSRRLSGFLGQLFLVFIQSLIKVRLFKHCVPCVSLIACKRVIDQELNAFD